MTNLSGDSNGGHSSSSGYGSIWDRGRKLGKRSPFVPRPSLSDFSEQSGSASCFTIETNACHCEGVKLALINGASSTHRHRVQKVPPQNKKIAHNRLLLLEIDSVAKVQLSGEHPALQERTGKPPWWSDRNRRSVVLLMSFANFTSRFQ
jgi:hypothetical protein